LSAIPDSTLHPEHFTLSFRPDLTEGTHSIYVRSYDINGNAGQSEIIQFQVSRELAIQFLGNHPNPFRKETVFVYVLTDIARETSIKIYTTAGKLIRTLQSSDMSTADYHEVAWDGTDEWGNEVANGVYFFRLRTAAEKVKEITGKIAKLQ